MPMAGRPRFASTWVPISGSGSSTSSTPAAEPCAALSGRYTNSSSGKSLRGGSRARCGCYRSASIRPNDDAVALHDYAVRMGLKPEVWSVVTLASASDRQQLLDAFGIMVLPARDGEFEHNAALHIVDGRGRLVRILDYDAPGRALDAALALDP